MGGHLASIVFRKELKMGGHSNEKWIFVRAGGLKWMDRDDSLVKNKRSIRI